MVHIKYKLIVQFGERVLAIGPHIYFLRIIRRYDFDARRFHSRARFLLGSLALVFFRDDIVVVVISRAFNRKLCKH